MEIYKSSCAACTKEKEAKFKGFFRGDVAQAKEEAILKDFDGYFLEYYNAVKKFSKESFPKGYHFVFEKPRICISSQNFAYYSSTGTNAIYFPEKDFKNRKQILFHELTHSFIFQNFVGLALFYKSASAKDFEFSAQLGDNFDKLTEGSAFLVEQLYLANLDFSSPRRDQIKIFEKVFGEFFSSIEPVVDRFSQYNTISKGAGKSFLKWISENKESAMQNIAAKSLGDYRYSSYFPMLSRMTNEFYYLYLVPSFKIFSEFVNNGDKNIVLTIMKELRSFAESGSAAVDSLPDLSKIALEKPGIKNLKDQFSALRILLPNSFFGKDSIEKGLKDYKSNIEFFEFLDANF